MKVCRYCRVFLDESMFCKRSSTPDNISDRCKNCDKIARQERKSLNKDYQQSYYLKKQRAVAIV